MTGTWYVANDLGFGATYGKFDAGVGEAVRYGRHKSPADAIHIRWRRISGKFSYH